ncbi:MAG: hypothetical protein ACO2ZZ_05965 [Cyclobacteriaceae bacterium]|jgi:uncharacterized membrane protein YcgQ (UPF0703/DUF1980 family)
MNQFHAILIIFIQLTGWELLSKVSWERVFDEMLGQETEIPQFSDTLRKSEGSEITISGFVIPLQSGIEQQYFVLSRFPFQNCFFCGAAGPETVAEVYPVAPRSDLKPDQRITVRGLLSLNDSDPLHLTYIIKEAEIITN